jgi:hypothetical protein
MYRDTAPALDEYDRAVGAILIGEALIEECERTAVRCQQPDGIPPQDRWRALTDINDTYPEIWRHLDRARRVLARRGGNTARYDELRPSARRAATRSDADDMRTQRIDPTAFDEARRAIEELKLAVPGVDWQAIDARTQGLVNAPIARRRRHRIALGVAVVAFSLAAFAWFLALVPDHKPTRREVMRREISQIQDLRKLRIISLTGQLGERCEPALAHELIRLLVLDGRGPDASTFGAGYLDRCGDDIVIEHWAHAPMPPRR